MQFHKLFWATLIKYFKNLHQHNFSHRNQNFLQAAHNNCFMGFNSNGFYYLYFELNSIILFKKIIVLIDDANTNPTVAKQFIKSQICDNPDESIIHYYLDVAHNSDILEFKIIFNGASIP